MKDLAIMEALEVCLVGKTPEEIKKGLECAETKHCTFRYCHYYSRDEDTGSCIEQSRVDALALIRRYEAQLAEKDAQIADLERERDAALDMVRGDCGICAHWKECVENDFNLDSNYTSCWEWRGAQEVEK